MQRATTVLTSILMLGCVPKGGAAEAEDESGGGPPAACVAHGWDTSLAAFEALAEQADHSYWYSVFTGEYLNDFQPSCVYRTTIEVVGGVVVRRELALDHVIDGTLPEDCTGVPFIEEGAEVGSSVGGFEFPPYTMPELYDGCCELLALEPEDMYSDGFEVDAAGVMRQCYAIENGCGEGCEASVDGFRGVSFAEFAFGPRP